MKIGVDLDDVLTDTLLAVIEYHNAVYRTSLKFESFFSFKYWEVWGGTKEQAIQKVFDFYQTPYFKKLKPISGTPEALAQIKKMGNELYLITSRQEVVTDETKSWIKQYFPGIFSEIFITNTFSLSGLSKTKKEICDLVKIEVMIDDSLEYALNCLAPERKVLLLDSPWNKSAELPDGISRVYSWQDIIKAIEA